MRMIAFRAGLIDHTLLTMLARRNKTRADEIMRSIARNLKNYASQPALYHAAREKLLQTLDALNPQ